MITIDCEQGSPEWIEARLGIPTASAFARILTPKTRKLGAGADTYLAELVAEWMLGASLDQYVSEWMERGKDLEDQAVAYYELQQDAETAKVGLLLTDDRSAGCSPDRLVGDHGGLEIKCPGPVQHVKNLLDMREKHYFQCQGALWVTGRRWWDLMSYHPEMPPAIVRYTRDEDCIRDLAGAIETFSARLRAARDQMVAKGHVADRLTV